MKRSFPAILLLVLVFAFLNFSPLFAQEAAPDYNQIINSTKIYDIIVTPWTRAKKDEIVTAVEMGKAVAAFESASWLSVGEKYKAFQAIAEKKKAFAAACKTRVEIEAGIEKAGMTDMGQKVYKMLLSGTDYIAKLSNDGPIFSDLVKSYDSTVTSLVNYDSVSWWSPFKKLAKAKDLKNTMKSTYQSADRFMKSNTYNRLAQLIKLLTGAIGKPISGVNIDTGSIGGIVDIVKNAGGIIDALGGIFKNLSPAQAPANAGNASSNPPQNGIQAAGDLNLSGAMNGSIDDMTKRYNTLMRQYYDQIKTGRNPSELDPMLEEIKQLKEKIGAR